MKILAMDTSNQALSLALVDGDQLMVEITTHTKQTHGERLMPLIEEAFENAPFTLQEIDRIVVAQGPGSYTGLRIAATTAKSLAWSLDKDLVGVSSLLALAGRVPSDPALVLPVMDARRGNIYTGLYEKKAGQWQVLVSDRHVEATLFADQLAQSDLTQGRQLILAGEDGQKFAPLFSERLGQELAVLPLSQALPSAYQLALIGKDLDSQDVHQFTPSYLKLTEAEENWIKDQEGGD